MNDAEKLISLLQKASEDIEHADISVAELSPEYESLGHELCTVLSQIQELCLFIGSMADGNIDAPVPGKKNPFVGTSKDLFYKLKHLTWQAQQVSKGDYSQHVDFLGSFSDSFNTMIDDLNKRAKMIEQHEEELNREVERKNILLKRQMERQLAHYHAYLTFTGNFHSFRKRYKEMMGEVYSLFQSGEYEKGRLLIATINDEMRDDVEIHQEYSNHEFVNACLTDMAEICRERKIEYSFSLYIPPSLFLPPDVTADLILALSDYAFSQFGFGYVNHVNISSKTKSGWLSIIMECTFEKVGKDTSQHENYNEFMRSAEEVTAFSQKHNGLFDYKIDENGGKITSSFHYCMI